MKPLQVAALGTAGLLALSIALAGCSSKTEQGGTVASTSQEQPAEKKMRLVGEFKFVRHVSQDDSGTTASKMKLSKDVELTAEGSFSELVTIAPDLADGSMQFNVVDPASPHIHATATEKGHMDLDDPDGNGIVKSHEESAFSGSITEYPEVSIKRSRLGAGDEVSIRLHAKLAGKAPVAATMSNGAVVQSEELAQASLLDKIDGEPGQREFKLDLDMLPTLGSRPEVDAHGDPNDSDKMSRDMEIKLDQQLYDAIKKDPSLHYLGLVTSPQRDHWDYTGEISPVGKNTGSIKWTESVHLSMRLEKP
ncbi:hypothetical protein [Dyella subtropica]|uniref:hypothetical protein n=1 Tax=Dyella subtropica TaxID=2992127 RepID=UPI002252AE2F|nr:hypothetical protein [Dyella subtropica]